MAAEKMRAFKIDELLKRKTVPVDVYIQINADRYVVVIKANDEVLKDRLDKYKAKGATHLHVKASDYPTLFGEYIFAAGMKLKPLSMTWGPAANLEKLSGDFFEHLKIIGFNNELVDRASETCKSVVHLIANHEPIQNLLEKQLKVSEREAGHLTVVAAIAAMLAECANWENQATREEMALAAYLHDIGKANLPSDVTAKPLSKMSFDESMIYRTHADFTRDSLKQLKTLSEELVSWASDHHEYYDGTGYPRGIKLAQIDPMGSVIALANAVADIITNASTATTPKEIFRERDWVRAQEEIERNRVPQFHPDAIAALRKLLDIQWKRGAA